MTAARRLRIFRQALSAFSLVLAVAVAIPALRAQVSADEQRKRELFLRTREAIDPAPAPAPTSTPVRPQPRPRPGAPRPERSSEPVTLPAPKPSATPKPPAPRPTPATKPTPRATETPEPEETPAPTPPEPEKTPPQKIDSGYKLPPPREGAGAAATPKPEPSERPPEASPSPPASPVPALSPAPEAPITVEKSGVEEEQGYVPPPEPERRGLFGLFSGPSYRYLNRSVRAAIDRAPVKRGRWQYIVVHNSGTRQGNARIFNNYHLNVRKMKNGMAYHFVIGNGTSSGDGEIEIGSRWTKQINGGHVASDYLNDISLGICLVGDINRDQPTPAQLAALDELIRYLRGRVGKSKGHAAIVKAHREINPKPTDCPGDRFPYRWLHRRFD